MQTTRVLLICSIIVTAAAAPSALAQSAAEEGKLQHFDPQQADRSLDPCQDFYKFSCQKWFSANPIPADQVYWSTSSGLNNWNLSLFKNIRIREKASVQFRAEAYNAFNHTQFNAVNVAPKWSYTTGAVSAAQFGQITSARDPRILQFALRLNFGGAGGAAAY